MMDSTIKCPVQPTTMGGARETMALYQTFTASGGTWPWDLSIVVKALSMLHEELSATAKRRKGDW